MKTLEELVQAQLVAYNNRDLESFCACYHPDVKLIDLFSERIACEGLQQFKEIYRRLFDSSPELHCRLKNRIVLENAVIDEEFVTGIEKFPEGLHTAAIYRAKDGLIDCVWFPR